MVPYSNLFHDVNNLWVVSMLLGLIRWVQKTLNNKHAGKNKFAIGCKKKEDILQNNMMQQHLYHGGLI